LLRIAKVKQTTTNGIDSTSGVEKLLGCNPVGDCPYDPPEKECHDSVENAPGFLGWTGFPTAWSPLRSRTHCEKAAC
ncbi:MAG: hypothetical protein MZV63_63275, partial [Marinilabiliales bacterium]|nr:hypothetical protein [Marinilabiliales bacterium]